MPQSARLAVWCALFISVIMPFVVWIWSRPTAFAIRGTELEIIWPARRRLLPLRGLESVEIVQPHAFRKRYGRAMRVGIGGLWGGFGSAVTKSETFHLYVSRTDRFVLLRPAGVKPWVLTPAQAEQFVEAVNAPPRHAPRPGVVLPAADAAGRRESRPEEMRSERTRRLGNG